MSHRVRIVALLAGCLLVAGCSKAPAPPGESGTATLEQAVYTTFYPTTWFTKRIAGDLVPVHCPLPPDEDAIFWQPARETIERYQNAALVVINGAEFEKWAMTAPLARSRVVDTAAVVTEPFIEFKCFGHSHGAAGEHSHDGIDGHTWVDPVNAIAQAGVIRDALVRTWPEHEAAFAAGYSALERDLSALKARLDALNDGVDGGRSIHVFRIVASHPAFNYMGRRQGWDIHSFDFDPEATMAGASIADIRRVLAEGDPTRPVILLWEGEPADAVLEQIEDFGMKSVYFSPAENVDEAAEGDYLEIMNANLDRLEAAMK